MYHISLPFSHTLSLSPLQHNLLSKRSSETVAHWAEWVEARLWFIHVAGEEAASRYRYTPEIYTVNTAPSLRSGPLMHFRVTGQVSVHCLKFPHLSFLIPFFNARAGMDSENLKPFSRPLCKSCTSGFLIWEFINSTFEGFTSYVYCKSWTSFTTQSQTLQQRCTAQIYCYRPSCFIAFSNAAPSTCSPWQA